MGLRDELARLRTQVGAHVQATRPVTVVIEVEGDVAGDTCGLQLLPYPRRRAPRGAAALADGSRTPPT
jgi:hypothetical protein